MKVIREFFFARAKRFTLEMTAQEVKVMLCLMRGQELRRGQDSTSITLMTRILEELDLTTGLEGRRDAGV